MSKAVKKIPEGYHTITPALGVKDSAKAIEFYKKSFGAKEVMRFPAAGGRGIMHAELQIGDSRFFISDEMPNMGSKSPETIGGVASTLSLYVEDTDAMYKQDTSAGAKECMSPVDMFWGDRFSKLTDPFGHQWTIATHIEDVAPEEMKK